MITQVIEVDDKNIDSQKQTFTIKVKIGGEDYHDLFIEYSNDKEAHQQIFEKISSISGISLEKIRSITMKSADNRNGLRFELRSPYRPKEKDSFSTIVQNGYLKDGDCYALKMTLSDAGLRPRYLTFDLIPRPHFDDNQCTWDRVHGIFCQHINSRAYMKRQAKLLHESRAGQRAPFCRLMYDYIQRLRNNPLVDVQPILAKLSNPYECYPRNRG